MRINGPCQKCTSRSPACWDTCPGYKEFREKIKEAEERRREAMSALHAQELMLAHRPRWYGQI